MTGAPPSGWTARPTGTTTPTWRPTTRCWLSSLVGTGRAARCLKVLEAHAGDYDERCPRGATPAAGWTAPPTATPPAQRRTVVGSAARTFVAIPPRPRRSGDARTHWVTAGARSSADITPTVARFQRAAVLDRHGGERGVGTGITSVKTQRERPRSPAEAPPHRPAGSRYPHQPVRRDRAVPRRLLRPPPRCDLRRHGRAVTPPTSR